MTLDIGITKTQNGWNIMTLPDERYRAVIRTRQLLANLCNPQHTPRVSKLIRSEARSCLRHFPTEWDLHEAAMDAPHVFQEKIEPVYRLILEHENTQKPNIEIK